MTEQATGQVMDALSAKRIADNRWCEICIMAEEIVELATRNSLMGKVSFDYVISSPTRCTYTTISHVIEKAKALFNCPFINVTLNYYKKDSATIAVDWAYAYTHQLHANYEAYQVERRIEDILKKIDVAAYNSDFSLVTFIRQPMVIEHFRKLGFTVEPLYKESTVHDMEHVQVISW